jgi:hypothetical protein
MAISYLQARATVLCFLTIFASILVNADTNAENALPAVVGPIPVSADSHPFGAADHTLKSQDLMTFGYVEEEYFISGLANVYDWPERNKLQVRTANAPYTTRVLVRRPINKTDFSGNVVVEMLNPSNLFDLNIGWAISHQQMLRNGDAWVGITAKPIAVVTLKQFDPTRYESLSWANPLSLDHPDNCDAERRDTVKATENGLVWDINTQVAMWLRSPASSNPFRYSGNASAAEKLYGWGFSQTGSFLYTYINALHPQVTKDYGQALFDGYIVAVSSRPASINQCALPLERDDPRQPIQNVGVPVIHIMSQSDYLSGISSRQPDSDESGNQFRHYEIAGSGHASPDELYWGPKPEDLIKAGREVPPVACNEGQRSRFPNSVFFNAALTGLDSWVREGVAPPKAEPILVKDGKPVLDQHGNVIGGVRSPFVNVPTSTWNGNSTGESFCRIAGHEIPFTAAKLKQLYPTQQAYIDAFTSSVEALVQKGFIVAADGQLLIEQSKTLRLY